MKETGLRMSSEALAALEEQSELAEVCTEPQDIQHAENQLEKEGVPSTSDSGQAEKRKKMVSCNRNGIWIHTE